MSKKEILSLIQQYSTIIIHRHVRPDPDAYGSQGGLGEMIKQSFPDKKVLLAGEEDSSLTFLNTLDHIDDDTYDDALVIVCDTANEARVCDQRYTKGKALVKIDHHPNLDPYGDVMWVDTEASSTSEMIYELFLAGKEEGFQLNEKAARLIYAGIVGDTGRFLFPSTTEKTFRYASELVAYEFDRPELYRHLYNTEHHIAHLKGYILQNFSVSKSGLSTVKITKTIMDQYGIQPDETSQLVGVLGDIEGIVTWAFFIEEEDLIRVRLRSKGPVINDIAAKYNGGGHPLASGASVSNWEEVEPIIEDLETVCKQYQLEQNK
ncbi:DHH family phosphoesterase [Salirhabdus salicampi]|uniref:DHH family phosphoesterase n=1 Tax=Salirhabdus salicampi TaxID=476102 RepID=UPI0020C2C85F|nr:bifunctional oligoribonuclease/PAP phosphatase NrnA [Salirhabdus salicampi]MCP8617109.1 bifunctional oligoribonuclease/PAP phosphatase NrnA [Salirhabdus salicampi]